MPIQFVCNHCRKLLSVGSRKVGSTVTCPKCNQSVVVPTPEVAAAGVAMRESLKSPPVDEPIPEFVVYDDEEGEYPADPPPPEIVIQTSPPKPPRAAPPPPANGAAAPPWTSRGEAPKGRAAGAAGDQMILVSRNVLYVQAGLFAVVAVVGLGIGFLIGRGTMPDDEIAQRPVTPEAVVLQGSVTYMVGDANTRPDAGAVIVAVPEGKIPNPKLAISGLRPQDPLPRPGSQALLALEDLGGSYSRAKDDGSYSLTLPRAGKYFVFFISRQTQRPAGTPPDEFDVAVMNRYFQDAEKLVGNFKYRWRNETLEGPLVAKSHDFGKSGEL